MSVKKVQDVSTKNGCPAIPVVQKDAFTRFSAWTTRATGGRWAFLLAFGTVIAWAISGPYFHYSDNWQLVINTGTTIVTFLMVFLIQNAQNRESRAVHLKLDELILAVRNARNEMIEIENLTEEQLEKLSERHHTRAQREGTTPGEPHASRGALGAHTRAGSNELN